VVPAFPVQPVSFAESTVEVQLLLEAEPGRNVLLVGANLPTDSPLPATVRLPLPQGATVFWAGEITGLGPERDLRRDHTIVEVSGGQAVEFRVETTRSVQYDATYGAVDLVDGERRTELVWPQSVEISDLSFALRLPAGTELIEPRVLRPPQTNAAGERLYTLEPVRLSVGQSTTIGVGYRTAAEPASQQGRVTLMSWLMFAVGIAVFLLALVILVQRRASQSG